MANERLRTAMVNARIDIDQVAAATKVDPKTVQRWLAGRVPHPRHRWRVSELVEQEEGYLWPTAQPDVAPGAPATSEVVTAYAHRTDVPPSTWNDLLARSCRQIDIIGYSFLFLPEQMVNLAKGNQSGVPWLVDHAGCGGIQALPVRASRMAARGWRPWLRAVVR